MAKMEIFQLGVSISHFSLMHSLSNRQMDVFPSFLRQPGICIAIGSGRRCQSIPVKNMEALPVYASCGQSEAV